MLHPAVVIDDDEALAVAMAAVASAMADPSRVKILCALMDGRAWTATELSGAADISPSTASAHLSRLVNSRLLICGARATSLLSAGGRRCRRIAGKYDDHGGQKRSAADHANAGNAAYGAYLLRSSGG